MMRTTTILVLLPAALAFAGGCPNGNDGTDGAPGTDGGGGATDSGGGATDSGGGATDSGGGATDSGGGATDSGGGATDSGTTMGCAPGTCRLDPSGPCEAPTGPMGNGCCECTGDACTAFCVCAAPDTRVATPMGERAMADLREGDLVYSVDGEAIVAVPLIATRRSAVRADHVVVRVTLEDGAVIEMSPLHPTADGRRFGDLAAGGALDGRRIRSADLVSYGRPATHDILPASDTGTYFASGTRVGSTLF